MNDRIVVLVEEWWDLVIRIGGRADSPLISRPLARTLLVRCAWPRYLRRVGTPRAPQDLARHAVLAYSLFSSGNLWTLHRATEQVQVRITPRLLTNNGDTCVQAALGHAGIVLQPDFLVGPALAEGRLVQILKGWEAGELGIHAVYPSREHVSPKVRLLIDDLARRLPARLEQG